jgi:hypothetical protein
MIAAVQERRRAAWGAPGSLLFLGLLAAGGCAPAATPPAGADAGADADRDAAPGADAASTCEPGPGATTGKLVRVVLLVPADRTPDPRHIASLEQATRAAQLWLRARTTQGTSFRVHDPVVEVVTLSQDEAFYRDNDPGSAEDLRFWSNTLTEAFAETGGAFDAPDDVWLYYMDAEPGCGQRTGATSQVALFPRNDLRGLLDEERVPPCGGDPDSYPRCRWVGGMLLLMTQALGIPPPEACTDGDPETICPQDNIRWLGYLSFPEATLEPAQLEALSGTGFVNAIGLPSCELDCNAVPAP